MITRRSALRGGLAAAAIAIARPAPGSAGNFERTLANILISEGGNDDDKRDPGGRTSRGIIQREWTAWRHMHAEDLPDDVWEAPQSEIVAIYRVRYWDVMRGDELLRGLDYSVVDYAVNSGTGRAGKVLHRALGLRDDGWQVDDEVLAAIGRRDAKVLIRAINDERLRFLRQLHTWPVFGTGWARRVASVRAISLAMAGGTVRGSGGLLTPAYGPHKAFDADAELGGTP
jgi:lysozyme family protein